METPISKSQKRAMALAGVAMVDSYESAASILEAAGLRRDGVPLNKTWREAAKMSDADLLAAIKETDEDRFARTTRERVEY